jgi:hypothetical protein
MTPTVLPSSAVPRRLVASYAQAQMCAATALSYKQQHTQQLPHSLKETTVSLEPLYDHNGEQQLVAGVHNAHLTKQ